MVCRERMSDAPFQLIARYGAFFVVLEHGSLDLFSYHSRVPLSFARSPFRSSYMRQCPPLRHCFVWSLSRLVDWSILYHVECVIALREVLGESARREVSARSRSVPEVLRFRSGFGFLIF